MSVDDNNKLTKKNVFVVVHTKDIIFIGDHK